MSDYDDPIELEMDPWPEARRESEVVADLRAAEAPSLPEADLTRSQAQVIARLPSTLATWFATAVESARARQADMAAAATERTEAEARTRASAADWQANHAAQMAAIQGRAIPVPAEPESRPTLTAHDMVVGAETAGSGVITGWSGSGELTRIDLQTILTGAGFPEHWAPEPKTPHAHAGFALALLNQVGSVVRADRGGRRRGERLASSDGLVRKFAGRWIVGTANARAGVVGDAFGQIAMTAILYTDGRLECVGQPDLCARVTEDYQRRVDSEVYPAGEVTLWLRSLLAKRLGGVRMGGVWYVPRRHAVECHKLVAVLSSAWGLDWISPPLPMATSTQLLQGLTAGLVREATEVLTDLETARASARATGASEIRSGAATTLYKRLMVVADRAKGYADLLGPGHVAAVRASLQAALDIIKPLCDDISLRYAALEF